MSNLFKAALLLGGLLWQSMGLASDTGWLTSPQNDHARVRLQADRSTADQTRILLDIELESGWKTYWHSREKGALPPRSCGMSRSATSSGAGPLRATSRWPDSVPRVIRVRCVSP